MADPQTTAPDITQLSDDQLKQLALQSMPDDELKALHSSTSGIGVAADVAKQVGAGLVQGVADIPTAIPRLLNAAAPAINSAVSNVVGKFSPTKAQDMQDAETQRQALVASIHAPTMADFLPAPQTTEGQYARTVGEFVPGMMAAPGSLAKNAITGATAGLASEGAGQATAGTSLEPYARIAAGVGTGLVGAGALAPKAGTLTPDNVIAAGSQGYQSPILKQILISPGTVQKISDNTLDQLDKARLNDRLAPLTRGIVSDLATPIGGALHSVEDFQTTRTLLGKVAQNFNNPIEQGAATQAIKSLDQQFGAIPQSDLVSGNIGAANDVLTNARADYAKGMAAQRVQGKIDSAELQAGSAHSGGNIDNAIRQKLRPILTSPKQASGLTEDQLNSIDNTVVGSTPGNILRTAGSIMGGRGGLGSLVAAAEGMHVAGPAGALMPVAGYGIKSLGDALTRSKANQVVQNILSGAPSASNFQPTPQGLTPLAAILAGAKSGAMSQPQTQVPSQ
jgi:hypothetical protein